MDEALRRLERGGDPVAHAAALRRAGDEVRARRALEAAVRVGHHGARATLDAWWPLDPRVDAVVAAALGDANHWRWSNVRAALAWLLGDEDPRVDDTLARLTTALLEQTGVPVDSAGWRDDERLIAVARGDAEARRRAVVEQAGEELPLRCLSRARLDAAGVRALLARAREPVEEHDRRGERRLLLASTLWHAGRAGVLEPLREHLDAADPLVASEAAAPLAAYDLDALRPALLHDRPFRPVWAPPGCPAETRDVLTGALDRAAFVADPAAPLVSDAPREAPMTDWLLDVDVDGMRRILELHGVPVSDQVLIDIVACLQRCVGDRVARWSGDEWLVRLEADVDARAVAESLRRAVRALEHADSLRVTVSVGIGRADTWAQAIIRASTAASLAAQEGGDRVREAC